MGRKRKVNAYRKDILRNIRGGKKRFIAIAVITLLGVMMFSGLQASCEDLRKSADRFFDEQKLHDLSVVSTLGLTEEDAEALRSVQGIEEAEGIYSEKVSADIGGVSMSVQLETLSENETDVPYVVEGRLPENADESAVTQKFIEDSGLSVGDSFTIDKDASDDEGTDEDRDEEESGSVRSEQSDESADDGMEDSGEQESDENLDLNLDVDADVDVDTDTQESASYNVTTFTIVGVVVDPTDVDNPFSAVSYRTDSSAADKAYIRKDAVDADYYTQVNLRILGVADLECYSDAYEDAVDAVRTDIEDNIKEDRELARTESVKNEAQSQLDDAAKNAEEKLAQAQQKLEDGQDELEDRLADAKQELEEGEAELSDGKAQLADGKQQITDAEEQLDEAQAQLDAQKEQAEQQIADGRAQIEAGKEQLNQQITALQAQVEALQEALGIGTSGDTESSAGNSDSAAAESAGVGAAVDPAVAAAYQQEIAKDQAVIAGLNEQLAALEQQEAALDAQEAQAKQQIAAGQAEIDANRTALEESEAELKSHEEEIADSEKKLQDGWDDYYSGKEEGEQELADGWEKYRAGEADAREQIDDAQEQIDAIDTAEWYVQDRTSLSGYSDIGSDADSIQAIGTVFPIVFFAVAILISLTTVARMVDEDRGLIGTYKSLGFTDSEIRAKYLIYSLLACLSGSATGTVMAFVGLPTFIFYVFGVMYLLPSYDRFFLWTYGITGPVLFTLGVLAATWAACRKELMDTPASLMRPKSPRAGSRVFLERLTPVWSRMSFLNKVTARNLFRYKGRLFMTVFGIGGCMALLLFGFAIKDSVTDLEPRQYDQTSLFDVMAVSTADDNEKLLSYADSGGQTEDYVNVEITSVKLMREEGVVSAQLIVVPDGTDFSGYVNLEGIHTGENFTLDDGAVYVTRNAGDVLGFDDGDTITMQLLDLEENTVTVTALVKNYLSNYVYMSASTYEAYYDAFEPNALLIHLSDACTDPVGYADELAGKDGIVSVMSVAKLRSQFYLSFQLINMVVYIVILMSAALAFVVLFTLSTTNISERVREIATIKVLGFYDPEVHAYVNKEMMILTGIGIVLGIPLGRVFAGTLTSILKLPSIYLAVSLHGISYVYAMILTLVFAIIVSLMTNRTLNEIDPATALKSVE